MYWLKYVIMNPSYEIKDGSDKCDSTLIFVFFSLTRATANYTFVLQVHDATFKNMHHVFNVCFNKIFSQKADDIPHYLHVSHKYIPF